MKKIKYSMHKNIFYHLLITSHSDWDRVPCKKKKFNNLNKMELKLFLFTLFCF